MPRTNKEESDPGAILACSSYPHLYFILSVEISLVDAIAGKARKAAETGEFYVPVFDLLRG
jgi:hypothetical protein